MNQWFLFQKYHPLCSSMFASQIFLDLFPPNNRPVSTDVLDFTLFAPSIIKLAMKLCQLSQTIVKDARALFDKTEYVSATLTSEVDFLKIANKVSTAFQNELPIGFKRLLNLLRNSANVNQLMTASLSNAKLTGCCVSSIDTFFYLKSVNMTQKYLYDAICNCATSNVSCATSFASHFIGFPDPIFDAGIAINKNIIGLNTACNPAESILHSNLECLYDDKCLKTTAMALVYSNLFSDFLLNIFSRIKMNDEFLVISKQNTAVSDIVDRLMIEQWSLNISFDNYFEQCKPNVCVYTLKKRLDIVITIVTIIGLAGGLSVVWRIVTPVFVAAIRRLLKKQTETVINAWQSKGLITMHCFDSFFLNS